MRNKAWAVPVLIAVALTATACSKATGYNTGSGAGGAYGTGSSSAGPGTSSRPATSGAMGGGVQTAALKVERTSAGMVLAGRKGLTLYYYAQDKPGTGTSACTGGCATAWPPLTAPVRAPAGVKMPGPIGMITRAGGVKQVTINGYPVYYYAEDMAPGQAKGNGEAGKWHVIKIKMRSGSAGSMGTSGNSAGSGNGRGYGY
jgi:predicted lipoprotein with Yx(FWY)xxD motif